MDFSFLFFQKGEEIDFLFFFMGEKGDIKKLSFNRLFGNFFFVFQR